jgi:EmrB/QacA subfamily drug resistance transporter
MTKITAMIGGPLAGIKNASRMQEDEMNSVAYQAGSLSKKKAVFLTASLVSSLIMLDSNIVAVSLPAIGRSLAASFTDIQWVISAYVLTYAALLLATGNYADLHGRRKAMLIGLVVFALSSAACGGATSALVLNLARGVQGVGGALLLTASLAIISHEFTGEEQASAFAFWGASLGIALAIGPIIGGTITNFFGWRWVFLVNLPLCALLIGATLKLVAESRDPDAKQLDFRGIVTFSLGLGLLIWALIDGNDDGWTSPGILTRLVVAGLLFTAFVIAELRQARPMVDFHLFEHRTFVGAVLAMIGYGAGAQVMVFFLPLFLQNAYGYAPIAAGVAMLPFALPMVLAPRVTSGLTSRYSGRAILTAGLAITVVGDLLFWFVARAQLSYSAFVIGMLVAGCGAGLLNGQTVKVLGGAVPPDRAGMASGLASTTRFIGILVSVAGMGAVLANIVHHAFGTAVMAAGLDQATAAAAAKRVTAGDLSGLLGDVPAAVRSMLHMAGLASFAAGFAAASLLAAIIAIISCVLTFLLVGARDTAPAGGQMRRPCKLVDCRDPL